MYLFLRFLVQKFHDLFAFICSYLLKDLLSLLSGCTEIVLTALLSSIKLKVLGTAIKIDRAPLDSFPPYSLITFSNYILVASSLSDRSMTACRGCLTRADIISCTTSRSPLYSVLFECDFRTLTVVTMIPSEMMTSTVKFYHPRLIS